ncbi:MAG TPA: hypothetical protein V6D19_03885 [Stenomitos sp.]
MQASVKVMQVTIERVTPSHFWLFRRFIVPIETKVAKAVGSVEEADMMTVLKQGTLLTHAIAVTIALLLLMSWNTAKPTSTPLNHGNIAANTLF